jgi:hypothetical protein
VSLLPRHGCRSGTGSDRAPADARSSSRATAGRVRIGGARNHRPTSRSPCGWRFPYPDAAVVRERRGARDPATFSRDRGTDELRRCCSSRRPRPLVRGIASGSGFAISGAHLRTVVAETQTRTGDTTIFRGVVMRRLWRRNACKSSASKLQSHGCTPSADTFGRFLAGLATSERVEVPSDACWRTPRAIEVRALWTPRGKRSNTGLSRVACDGVRGFRTVADRPWYASSQALLVMSAERERLVAVCVSRTAYPRPPRARAGSSRPGSPQSRPPYSRARS